MGKQHYVDTHELEDWWVGWMVTGCPYAWSEVTERIYRICNGIVRHFNPRDEEEANDHVHDAFVQTIEKIRTGKLVIIRGKAPVFNLVTTTIFRILYSKMNKQKKHREHLQKYYYQFIQKHAPEHLSKVEFPFEKKNVS